MGDAAGVGGLFRDIRDRVDDGCHLYVLDGVDRIHVLASESAGGAGNGNGTEFHGRDGTRL